MKKRYFLFVLLIVLALAVTACGGDDEPEVAEELPFGMVLVGPKNDHGWSQAHYDGGLYVEENLDGARLIAFESLNPADKPEATLEGVVDDMVADGAKLIFTTSDEFEEDTLGVAEKHEDITFINISGDDALTGEAPDNLGNIMGRMPDMKAIAGCAAALATDSGKIGYLGPLINHETRRLASSAYLGARYCYENFRGMNPDDLEFIVTWIGFWFNIPGVTLDPTEVTNSFIDGELQADMVARQFQAAALIQQQVLMLPASGQIRAMPSGPSPMILRRLAITPPISVWVFPISTGDPLILRLPRPWPMVLGNNPGIGIPPTGMT